MKRHDTRALTPRPAVRTQLHEPNYWPHVNEVLDEHRALMRKRWSFDGSGWLVLSLALVGAVLAVVVVLFARM